MAIIKKKIKTNAGEHLGEHKPVNTFCGNVN
jgi:hypothetical protein